MAIWLSEREVRDLLSMADLIEAMQGALDAFSNGGVDQPVRTVIEVKPGRSFFASMPAHASYLPALGAKLVTVFPDNAARGMHTHLATILLLDSETGALLCAMDGRAITEMRTAAVSAVAAKFLALARTQVLAVIGSGVQARSHLRALALIRQFEEVRCWSVTPARLARFVAEAKGSVKASENVEAAVRDADVIVLVTSSTQPVLREKWVKDGACVLAVGACRPAHREMDSDLVARGRLIVDSRHSALKEAGDIVIPMGEGRIGPGHIAAELGEVIRQPELGRTSAHQVMVFKSLGVAVEDLAAAHLAYRRALDLGRGLALA